MAKHIFFGFIIVFFCFAGCDSGGEGDVLKLATEKKLLTCKMERLKIQNDSLWNEMTAYLGKELPTDMPAPERTNMVRTRNAHLLTVFRVFPMLDTAIQHRVHRVGIIDAQMAAEMKSVMEQLHITERKLNFALGKLESNDKSKFASLKTELKKLRAQPCPPSDADFFNN